MAILLSDYTGNISGKAGLMRGGREGGKKRGTDGREERKGGRDGCDDNYEVGAYGMEWVHNREPERSRLTS